MSNRKGAEDFILKYVNELAPGNENVGIYQKLFEGMDDEAFEEYMTGIERGDKFVVFISPNFSQHALSVERNLLIAEELGHSFFQKLWVGQQGDTPAYLTPVEYLVMDEPMRRASQLLIKKIRVPEHNKQVDLLSKQPTGESRGSRVSWPELQVLSTMDLDDALIELIKFRGGDERGYRALTGSISRYGKASIQMLNNYASGVESTKTLKTVFTAMHLKSTL